MQKVRLRRGLWHRRDGRETPKGPHLIAKYTLSPHPDNIAAPSPSHPLPPGPRQLAYNLSYSDSFHSFLHQHGPFHKHTLALQYTLTLEGVVSDLTEGKCGLYIILSLYIVSGV